MHAAPQRVVPGAQVEGPQVPSKHSWPAAHATPQAPQFAALQPRSAQTPSQSVRPVSHAQLPLAQCEPPGQTVSQSPQWFTSVSRSTQSTPQRVSSQSRPPSVRAASSAGASTHSLPPPSTAGVWASIEGPPSTRARPASRGPGSPVAQPKAKRTRHTESEEASSHFILRG